MSVHISEFKKGDILWECGRGGNICMVATADAALAEGIWALPVIIVRKQREMELHEAANPGGYGLHLYRAPAYTHKEDYTLLEMIAEDMARGVLAPLHISNLGQWKQARKEWLCIGLNHSCSWIAKGARYWHADDGERYCEACATTPYRGRGARMFQLADPSYKPGDLIDYTGTGTVMVTPQQAASLDRGFVSEYDL